MLLRGEIFFSISCVLSITTKMHGEKLNFVKKLSVVMRNEHSRSQKLKRKLDEKSGIKIQQYRCAQNGQHQNREKSTVFWG